METALVICTRNRVESLEVMFCKVIETCSDVPPMVVVVDSSEGDETRMLVRRLAAEYNLKLHYLESASGLPHQRNVAVRWLRSNSPSCDAVFFLDDDVVPNKHYFSKANAVLAENPEIVVLGGFVRIPKRNPIVSAILTSLQITSVAPNNLSKAGFGTPCVPDIELQEVLWVPGGMQVIRAKALMEQYFNGRPRMYGEDVEMHLRLRRVGKIAVAQGLDVSHLAEQSGKDNLSTLVSFEDGFRWKLSKVHPELVSTKWVIIGTLVVALGTLFGRGSLLGKISCLSGHSIFLWRLLLGQEVEQFVTHDEWWS